MSWDEEEEQVEGADIDAVGEEEVVAGRPSSKFFPYVDVSSREREDYALA